MFPRDGNAAAGWLLRRACRAHRRWMAHGASVTRGGRWQTCTRGARELPALRQGLLLPASLQATSFRPCGGRGFVVGNGGAVTGRLGTCDTQGRIDRPGRALRFRRPGRTVCLCMPRRWASSAAHRPRDEAGCEEWSGGAGSRQRCGSSVCARASCARARESPVLTAAAAAAARLLLIDRLLGQAAPEAAILLQIN